MDFTLRCNSLKCRAQLTDRAVVTTCSHIFCIPCSEHLGLANAAPNAANHRVCPACRTALTNPDDVVATQLNPTEDYKTSVLSGLSPTVIMECAGRGLAFWSYQSTQEIVYQEYLAKSLTDKYSTLNHQLDKVIADANAEIENLNQRLAHLQTTHQTLKTDNANLVNALREKNRKHAQTQELYDRLKRKEMAAVTRSAALDSADETVLQSALVRNGSGGNRHGRQGSGGGPLGRGRPSPLGRFPNGGGFTGERGSAGGSPRKVQQNFIAGIGGGREMGPPPVPRQGGGGGFIGPQASHSPSLSSHHRTRLGGSVNNNSSFFDTATPSNSHFRGGANLGPISQFGTSISGQPNMQAQAPTPRFRRQPLQNISGSEINAAGGNGYGMSAGMRAGSMHGGVTGYESGVGGGVGGGVFEGFR